MAARVTKWLFPFSTTRSHAAERHGLCALLSGIILSMLLWPLVIDHVGGDVVAHFDGGNSTGVVDAYPGTVSDGVVNAAVPAMLLGLAAALVAFRRIGQTVE